MVYSSHLGHRFVFFGGTYYKKKEQFVSLYPLCRCHFSSLLDHRLWPEGSYELGSVLPPFCPSVLLSRSFLGIGSLFFSETQHDVRGPCLVVCDCWIFLKKSFCSKNGENGPKTGFF